MGDLPLPGEEPRLDEELASEKAKLDKAGRVSFPLPAAKPLPGLPVEVSYSALVSDPSGRAQGGEASTLVHPSGPVPWPQDPAFGHGRSQGRIQPGRGQL